MSAAVEDKNQTFQRQIEALFRQEYRFIYRAAYNVTGNSQERPATGS